MRKVIVAFLPLLFFVVFPQFQVNAQSITPGSNPSTISGQTVTPTEAIQQMPDYTLPFPGLLPDNPLYSLKVLRDRIVSFFIADPLKKSEFDLLQADKRLVAGMYLLKEGKSKEDLAVTTISKGENYFDSAVSSLQEAKKEGELVDSQQSRMQQAAQKHEAVIKDLMTQVDPKEKQALDRELQRVVGFEKQVGTIAKE